jgi:hypothetical protein
MPPADRDVTLNEAVIDLPLGATRCGAKHRAGTTTRGLDRSFEHATRSTTSDTGSRGGGQAPDDSAATESLAADRHRVGHAHLRWALGQLGCRRCEEPVELGLETIDEGNVPGDCAEHLEARSLCWS